MPTWYGNTETEGVVRHQCPICKCIFYNTTSRQRYCCEAHYEQGRKARQARYDHEKWERKKAMRKNEQERI